MSDHPVKRRKKLIEVAIPLEAINAASAREKSIRHGHPSTLHLWWARRPLAAARAVIFCQMVDDPSAVPVEFPTEEAQENERLRHFHHHHRHRRAGGAAAGLLHQRGRACPTGEGDHQHRGAERWGGVGLGLDQGLLEQAPIADGPSTAAITAPISGERLDAPAELVGSAADGAIGATGTAMEQQMDRPATAALKQSRVDARLRPDEITTTASDDDDRAMGQRRRRQEARKRQCSGLGHCSRGQAHGLQSKQTGQVVREIHCRRRWARGLWR